MSHNNQSPQSPRGKQSIGQNKVSLVSRATSGFARNFLFVSLAVALPFKVWCQNESQQSEATSLEQSAPLASEQTANSTAETARPSETKSIELNSSVLSPSASPSASSSASPSGSSRRTPKSESAPEQTRDPGELALRESRLGGNGGRGPFRRPLLFSPEDNGVTIGAAQLQWEMKDGREVNFAGLKISETSISFQFDQVSRQSVPDGLRSSERQTSPTSPASQLISNMSFSWPNPLTDAGVLTIETLSGETKLSFEIDDEAQQKWRNSFKGTSLASLKQHSSASWGVIDLEDDALKSLSQEGPFRTCLSTQNSNLEKLRICSAPFRIKKNAEFMELEPVRSTEQATVSLGDKAIGPRGVVNFRAGRPFTAKTVFRTGAFVEFSIQPPQLNLLDLTETASERWIIVTGKSEKRPLGPSRILERPTTSFWAPTGIDKDVIWQVALPREAPTMRVNATFNLPITVLVKFARLPKEQDRVFVRETTTENTYSSHPTLIGFADDGVTISSDELSAKNENENLFSWEFAAPNRGATNRARLKLNSPHAADHTWVASHELFRAYPFEASGRIAGVVSATGNPIPLGEAAASVWLESIGFGSHHVLSKQRWGLTTRYFKSITPLSISGSESNNDLSALNVDIKYNLISGVWNREELVGLTASYQNVSFGSLQASVAGAGFYWARSMPQFFNEIFEWLPIFRFPKYVDLEAIVYPTALSSNTSVQSFWNLNFHGKVFWTSRVFGEAGFGMKTFRFSDQAASGQVNFSTFFGTVGLGAIF